MKFNSSKGLMVLVFLLGFTSVRADDAIEKIGEPLELEELDAENATAGYKEDGDKAKNVIINDFIRFKRFAAESVSEKSEKKEEEEDSMRLKRERSGKMLLSTGQPEGSREPRGATKDQWIKQPYPVQTTNPHNFEENIPAVNEPARAPRVHFVTQRRSESAPPLVYHSYDHEGRSRDVNRPRDMEVNRGGYFQRPPRHYNPQLPPPPNFDHRPYYRRDERDRRQDYDYPDRYEEERPLYNYNKQRRIIYYATLPEVVRQPQSADRYGGYYDRYDNRFVTSLPVTVSTGENYRFRNGNGNPYNSKSRYDEASKTAYPTKVSTDVNVREIKKNPERRIYSEADRRYSYQAPNFHHTASYNN